MKITIRKITELLKIFSLGNRKINIIIAIFSAFLSASFAVGRKITIYTEPFFKKLQLNDIIFWLILSIVIYKCAIHLIFYLMNHSLKINESKSIKKKTWLYTMLILFLAWLPYLFSYYPGILTPDSLDSINQSLGLMQINNHHPILFTLFVKLILSIGMLIGDINFAVAFFSVVQMLIMAAILGYFVYCLAKKGLPKYVIVITTIFFAINPVIAMYSITMWKDIIFSGIMLLFIMFLIDVINSKGEMLLSLKGISYFSLFCLLISFGRNNGIFVVVAIIIALLFYIKKHIKKLIPVFISLILVITLIQGPVYTSFGIKKSPIAESFGIPLQQIAFAAKFDGQFTKEQEDFLNKLIPIEIMKNVYKPSIVNEIKFNEEFDGKLLEDNKVEFLKVWAMALPSNFSQYIKAYLMQTLGYYNIGTSNWVCRFGIYENELDLYNIDYINQTFGFSLKSPIHATITNIYKVPVINIIFSIAFWVWLTFFCCIILIIKKRSNLVISLLPLIILWATMMLATPTFCEFRYMYSLHLSLPLLILILFVKNNCPINDQGADIK